MESLHEEAFFLRNDFMSQTRPKVNAPESIKNNGTPTLKVAPKKHETNHFKEGTVAYPGAAMVCVVLKT